MKHDQSGAGTLYALGILFTSCTIVISLGCLSKVLLERHQLQNATDNAALVAADTLLGFIQGDICSNATAQLAKATLDRCEIGDSDVRLTTHTSTLFGFTITSHSRAGLAQQ
ncbi:MAG: flp pilus-assembly TadE/G-like family protein [Micrococcaceae bacterium]